MGGLNFLLMLRQALLSSLRLQEMGGTPFVEEALHQDHAHCVDGVALPSIDSESLGEGSA